MKMITPGTSVFFRDPESGSIVRLKRVTAFNPGGSPRTQIDNTDLEVLEAMQYVAGLGQPGQGTISINVHPSEPSHVILQELAEGGVTPVIDWFVGWSDGASDIVPTATGDGPVTLPTTRTWYRFSAFVSDFPLDFQINANVVVSGTLQRSGRGHWTPKEEAGGGD